MCRKIICPLEAEGFIWYAGSEAEAIEKKEGIMKLRANIVKTTALAAGLLTTLGALLAQEAGRSHPATRQLSFRRTLPPSCLA
jgi:hypothetical protein